MYFAACQHLLSDKKRAEIETVDSLCGRETCGVDARALNSISSSSEA
jgi:hypothetical protein